MAKLIVTDPGMETFESAMQKFEEQEKKAASAETPEQKAAREAAETPEQKAEREAAEASALASAETPEQKAAREAAETPEQKAAREKAELEAKGSAVFVMPEAFKTEFPEAQKPEDILSVYNAQKEELTSIKQASSELVDLVNKDKETGIILDYIANGKTLIEAIRLLPDIQSRLEPPDFEDKESYDKYQREKFEAEQQAKAQKERDAERQRIATEAATHAKSLRDNFIRSKNLSPEQATNFNGFIRTLTYGDPKTGRLPENVYEMYWRLFTLDSTLKAQEEEAEAKRKKAEIDAKNAGIEAGRKAAERRGDGIPNLKGGGPAPVPDEAQRMIEAFKPKSRLIVRDVV